MRFPAGCRATFPPLLVAAALACARPPGASEYGSVEIPVAGADAAGTPYRLHGEFTLSSVDSGLLRSASTRTAGTSEVIELRLPAGRYALTLSPAFVIESLPVCEQSATGRQLAWVNPARPPLIGVEGGQVARVRFELVAANRSPALAARARTVDAERETTTCPERAGL
jgi:hypothetical protein